MPEGADSVDAGALLEVVKALQGQGSAWATALAAGGSLIYVLHRFGVLSWLFKTRIEVQVESFQDKMLVAQDKMLAALDASHRREDQLLEKLGVVSKRNDELREEMHQTRFETYMMREQLKLLIAGLKQVKAGVIPIDALPEPEIGGPR